MYELQLWYSYGGMKDYIMKRGEYKDLTRRIKIVENCSSITIERIDLRRLSDEDVV